MFHLPKCVLSAPNDQAILTGDGETAKALVTWAVAAAREAKDDELSKTATLRYLEVQVPLTEDVIEGVLPPRVPNGAFRPGARLADDPVLDSGIEELLSDTFGIKWANDQD